MNNNNWNIINTANLFYIKYNIFPNILAFGLAYSYFNNVNLNCSLLEYYNNIHTYFNIIGLEYNSSIKLMNNILYNKYKIIIINADKLELMKF